MNEFYDEMWSGDAHARGLSPTLRRRKIVRFIRKYTPGSGLTLLDLGCGKGYLAEALSRFGQVTGVDFASGTVEQNRRRSPHITFICEDVTSPTLPRRLAQYDVVVASEVLEHIKVADRSQFFQNVDAVLRPGGLFVLTTPYKNSILRLKSPDESETEFFSRFEGQPISDIVSKEDLIATLERYFEFVDFASVQPCIKNRWLDYLWKGLFWPLNYRLVNGLTRVLGMEGKYMVVVAQKPAIG
jgi:SAM-dependent methyltransferase